jgi:hypothetical protein
LALKPGEKVFRLVLIASSISLAYMEEHLMARS